jgi:hypothetical protein
LHLNIVIHHADDRTAPYAINRGDQTTPVTHLLYNGVHYDALIPSLSLVWQGKYGESHYTPVAPVGEGTAIKSEYEKTKSKPDAAGTAGRWIGKYAGGTAGLTEAEEKRIEASKTRIRTARDAVHEVIGSHFYQMFAQSRFSTAKTRLAHLPLVDQHTIVPGTDPELAADIMRGIVDGINEGRPAGTEVRQALRSMSKRIKDYQDLDKLSECITATGVKPFAQCLREGIVPERVMIEGEELPINGLMTMLAVARVITDIDVLGGGGKNAGFTLNRDPETGKVTGVQLQKIDPGFAFSFDADANAFNRRGVRMTDQHDIQFGSGSSTHVIHWIELTPAQQNEFLAALDTMMTQLRNDAFMDYMIGRNGIFDQAGEGVWNRERIDFIKAELRINLERLSAVYNTELNAYHAANPPSAATPEPAFLFVPGTTFTTGAGAPSGGAGEPPVDRAAIRAAREKAWEEGTEFKGPE